MPVFNGNGKIRHRVIFEYTSQASMIVRYVPEQQMIVFDHLSPSQPKMQGHFDTYGPDMTYSGYKLIQSRWLFQDNLDMRNVPDSHDDMPYIDPKKQAAIDKATAASQNRR